MYNSQTGQDKFVVSILKQKMNGFFVEIGSNDHKKCNNTYILEKNYNWKGIMIERDSNYLNSYKEHRPNSIHIMEDATKIDFKDLFEIKNVPLQMDYLQIDLEVDNESTIQTLENLNKVMDKYTFATITFEHDIYRGNFFNTISRSRKIFEDRGYVCVFKNIQDVEPHYVYEDWYVHPSLVDIDYVNKIIAQNEVNYLDNSFINEKSINYKLITY
jgi:hypothetical protein